MINNVTLVGNIANEPVLSGSNALVLRFSIAVNEWMGENPERTSFFDCVLFGKRAAALREILKKGMKVAIAGKLRSSTYEKDGQKRYSVEVIINDIELPPLPPKNEA